LYILKHGLKFKKKIYVLPKERVPVFFTVLKNKTD